ncbi:MAG: YegS/Rv2252/BmrU family lipid kinase [Muribaculaceae bacterium]|nr:YegS/Rv2252/BmrU family lipid kinase [Muribaculaceae bacterium]
MKRALLVINPISGTLPKEGLAERVRERLAPAGFETEAVTTERAGHAARLAAAAMAEGYHAVIAAGGDGTVNEIAGALRSGPTALGILPYGSGNGLARHLYGSIDTDRALDIIARDNVEPCDYGTVNGRPFFCTFGLGFDAKVSREFAEMHSRGLASYIRSAVQEYLSYSPTVYEIRTGEHDVRIKAFIVAVCNASQYGNNAFIAPGASIRDGLLDITVIHVGNPLTRALAGVELFTGRLDRNVLIQTMRVRSALIRHLPGPGHIDGEPVMMPQTMEVMCHPGDLKILTDPDKPPFRPFITPIESIRDDSTFLVRENTRMAIRNIREKLGKIFTF